VEGTAGLWKAPGIMLEISPWNKVEDRKDEREEKVN